MKTFHQVQSPPASPPPPVLPDDLILEILSWLPVKSLLRFRCVCKSWESLISGTSFVKLHLHRSARNANLLLMWERNPPGNNVLVPCSVRSLLGNPSSIIDEECCIPFNGDVIDYEYEVIGSCNGLLCLGGYSNQNRFTEYCFCLCNPATKLSQDFACLPVNESHYNYKFAFGYDNLSDTYKVLAFMLFNGDAKEKSQKNQVKFCSFGDNCWRNIHSFPVIPFYNLDYQDNIEVYYNGTLNWLALCNINSDDYEWDDTITIAQLVIVSLDLGIETCIQMLLPRLDEAAPNEATIGVLIDCLCFSHDSNRTHFVIWQMKEFGVEKSWTQFMKVSYQDLQFDCLELPLIPLCTSENGDVLIMGTYDEWQAILYHRSDSRVERTKLPKYIHWYCSLDYVESLVSPYCSCGWLII